MAFKLASKEGSNSFANTSPPPVPKTPWLSKKTDPASPTKALRMAGLAFFISFAISCVVSPGREEWIRRNTMCWARAAARTATAVSLASLANKGVVAWRSVAEMPAAGCTYESMEYRAIRCSGPFVFPVLGRISNSWTAIRERLWRSSGSCRVTSALKSFTEFMRTFGLLDLELLINRASKRWNVLFWRGCLNARKKCVITR